MKNLFERSDLCRPAPPLAGAWESIRTLLRDRLDPEIFRNWILPLRTEMLQDQCLRIVADDLICYQALKGNLMEQITDCARRLGLGHLQLKLDFNEEDFPEFHSHQAEIESPQGASHARGHGTSESGLFSPEDFDLTQASVGSDAEDFRSRLEEFDASRIATTAASSGHLEAEALGLSPPNPKYTFENFVRGASNQFALASCLNVASNPGRVYNPLFIYGPTGLGKTHLLHSVGNRVRQNRPDLLVSYISSEQFMNEMIHSIRHNKMWDFRRKYRQPDVFLMDDIQFISGNKAATQEEFFHTFNALYEGKKQIIISSDLFPHDIPDIEERLRNRFNWGLIADIQPPNAEHRIAILMRKAEQLGMDLSLDIAELIAGQAIRNVRELEGALHRIAAFSALHGRAVDKALALEIFSGMSPPKRPLELDAPRIQRAVADHFGVKVADLKSNKRHRSLSLPRQVAMYLCRLRLNMSLPDIGKRFGGKNHSTVLHAVKKIERDRLICDPLRLDLEKIERLLQKFDSTRTCG